MNHMKLKIISSMKQKALLDTNTNSNLYFWTEITQQSKLVNVSTMRQ